MIAARASLARGIATARQARPLPARVVRGNLKPVLRRGYASGGDGHAAPSSDLPWLAGAIAVTVPSLWYLWPEPHEGGHGEHGGHDAHEEEHKDEAEGEEESKDDKEDSKADESKEDSGAESKDDGDKKDQKAESDDDDKSTDDGEKSADKKSKTGAGDEDSEQTETRKREPDGKGGFKKRIDSANQKDLGAGDKKDEDGKPSGKSATKPSGEDGAIDTKQAGLSTTPTRHSTQIDEDPEKSKKASGAPETAKSQTTVSPEQGKKK